MLRKEIFFFVYGEIPFNIGQLSVLEVFYMYTTGIGGTIPYSITKLNNLKVLILINDSFTSTIPSFIGNLSNSLEDLRLLSHFHGSIQNIHLEYC